jgi:hypothetical protein
MTARNRVIASPALYVAGAVLGAGVALVAGWPWWPASLIGTAVYVSGLAVRRAGSR